jgi:hypothetical protein
MLELKEQWNRARRGGEERMRGQMCVLIHPILLYEDRRTRDPAVVPRRSSPLEVRQYKIDAVMHACGRARGWSQLASKLVCNVQHGMEIDRASWWGESEKT